MPFNLRGPEILILILIIVLLFGAKRLPDVARGLGRSLRIFKAETKDLAGDGTADAPPADAPPAVAATPPAPLPPAAPAADASTPSAPSAPQPERTES